MGIRFTCPSGHKLHVKEFLAGKRGICPKCGARFTIPAPSSSATTSEPRGTSENTVGAELASQSILIAVEAEREVVVSAPVAERSANRTGPPTTAAAVPAAPPVETSASLFLAQRRRRQRRQVNLAILLLVAVIALALLLLWVLRRGAPSVASMSDASGSNGNVLVTHTAT